MEYLKENSSCIPILAILNENLCHTRLLLKEKLRIWGNYRAMVSKKKLFYPPRNVFRLYLRVPQKKNFILHLRPTNSPTLKATLCWCLADFVKSTHEFLTKNTQNTYPIHWYPTSGAPLHQDFFSTLRLCSIDKFYYVEVVERASD